MTGDAADGMLSSAQVDRLAAEWRRLRCEVIPPRARARLALHRAVDAAAIPLARHGHGNAARRLWTLFGMWR